MSEGTPPDALKKARANYKKAYDEFGKAKKEYLAFLDHSKRGDKKYDGAIDVLKKDLEEMGKMCKSPDQYDNNAGL